MTKQKLNLFQLAAVHMAELSARTAKIVWREMDQLHPLSDPSHHVLNEVLRIPLPQGVPCRLTARKIRPAVTFANLSIDRLHP